MPRGWERDASHNSPMILFIATTNRLECSSGLKGKLDLMKGSFVRLPLCRTWHHRTDHLLLHFHATSTMMPRAPPTVAPSLVLRQNWETLAWIASWWSKLPNVDACPHTVFIDSSGLRRKPIDLLPLGFEVQTKKPSQWFWGPNHQTVNLAISKQPNGLRWETNDCCPKRSSKGVKFKRERKKIRFEI
jgi:hypothetical protein